MFWFIFKVALKLSTSPSRLEVSAQFIGVPEIALSTKCLAEVTAICVTTCSVHACKCCGLHLIMASNFGYQTGVCFLRCFPFSHKMYSLSWSRTIENFEKKEKNQTTTTFAWTPVLHYTLYLGLAYMYVHHIYKCLELIFSYKNIFEGNQYLFVLQNQYQYYRCIILHFSNYLTVHNLH